MNLTPYRSVAGGLWGSIALVLVWLIHAVGKVEVPLEIGMAITVIVQTLGTQFAPKQSQPWEPSE